MRWLVVALLCACEPLPFVRDIDGHRARLDAVPTTWAFDCQFPDSQKMPVRLGFSYWNVLAGNEIFREEYDCTKVNEISSYFEVIVMASNTVHDEDKPLTEMGEIVFKSPTFATTARRMIEDRQIIGGVILVYLPWLQEPSLAIQTSVIRHEVGHVLGFEHNGVETCLMSEYINGEYHRYDDSPKSACREEKRDFLALYGGH